MPDASKPTVRETIENETGNLNSQTPTESSLSGIQGTYNKMLKGLENADTLSAKMDQLAEALANLCDNDPTAAQQAQQEAAQALNEHSGGNHLALRNYIRRAHAIIQALKSLDLEQLRQRGSQYLEQWAEMIKKTAGIDEAAVVVVKNILRAEQPNFDELRQVVGGELAAQLTILLEKMHQRYGAESGVIQEKFNAAEQRDELHSSFDAVTKGAIGTVPEEATIQKLGTYSDPNQTEELYNTLDEQQLLPRDSTLLLRFGRIPLFISWETKADDIKKGIRAALEQVKNKTAGTINHAQSWQRQNLAAYFDSLPDGTEFQATWIRDGSIVELRKTKKGEIDGNTVRSLAAEKEEQLDAKTFGQNLEHYVVNLRLK